MAFANKEGIRLVFTESYLQGNSKDAKFFAEWKKQSTIIKKVNIILPEQPAMPCQDNQIEIRAVAAFEQQSPHKKSLPSSRFWSKPNSLLESCVQEIATHLLERTHAHERSRLPVRLNKIIDERLTDAIYAIDDERIDCYKKIDTGLADAMLLIIHEQINGTSHIQPTFTA